MSTGGSARLFGRTLSWWTVMTCCCAWLGRTCSRGCRRAAGSAGATVATTRRLCAARSLIRVGDRADELYVVLSGEVKDSVVDADGEEVVHFLHGPGMTFG